jgi:hypothetical protein
MVTMDEDWERGSLTRSDVLAARGYDPALIAGNGHEPQPMTATRRISGTDLDAPVVARSTPAEVRLCEHCQTTPLGKGQARYCSRSCASKALAANGQAAAAAKQAAATEGIGALLAWASSAPAAVTGFDLAGGWHLSRR